MPGEDQGRADGEIQRQQRLGGREAPAGQDDLRQLLEGTAAGGDSGGPAFINGQIAGVVSGGIEYLDTDSDPLWRRSYGNSEFYTRVSAYADWIDMMTQSTSAEFLVNDVPLDPVTGLPLATGDQKWSSVASGL